MENEYISTHNFDLELICEYFSHLKRQGPGSPEMTIKALSFIDSLGQKSKIADIGCGTGGQTITLAEHTTGNLVGVDFFPDFINIFNDNAKKRNLQNRVKGIVGSMEELPFQREEFDLIWSEGAIYNIGFERGLKEWWNYLKKDGYIAVTEATWFTETRPSEIEDFWFKAYPAITTISNNVSTMQKAGYIPAAVFTLPENCWIDNYFTPQTSVQEELLKKYAGNKTVEAFIESERYEARMYHKYKEYFGYVFYIGKKYS